MGLKQLTSSEYIISGIYQFQFHQYSFEIAATEFIFKNMTIEKIKFTIAITENMKDTGLMKQCLVEIYIFWNSVYANSKINCLINNKHCMLTFFLYFIK